MNSGSFCLGQNGPSTSVEISFAPEWCNIFLSGGASHEPFRAVMRFLPVKIRIKGIAYCLQIVPFSHKTNFPLREGERER